MNRRATIQTLIGKSKRTKLPKSGFTLTSSGAGLEPYTGAWGKEQATHLLRRSMFGPNLDQIQAAVDNGLDDTVTQLTTPLQMPDPPVNYNFEDDPNVPIGATWIEAPYSQTINLKGYRRRSLLAWTYGLMLNEGVSLREKMTLFWHNHFVVQRSNVNDPKLNYIYINTLRQNALGNFKELAKKMTIDPSMLMYLNGNQNTSVAPNENYSRELLELFTIGKGPLAGPGDYTNYTEDDVVAMAKVLTGWRVRGFNTNNPMVSVESYFSIGRHDQSDKQLSHRFNNQIISNNGENEYKDLIDIIFQQDEVARFISRKLYRWFVYYDITPEIEDNVIEPMAQIIINNDYDIVQGLTALLSSAHFFESDNLGPMIKKPHRLYRLSFQTNRG